MLVVEAREIGRGRLLALEPDVLDRGRIGSGAISVYGSCLVLGRFYPQISRSNWKNIGSRNVG